MARRAHFRLELKRKLEQRRYESEEIEEELERLAADGYLDDAGTAEIYLAGRLRRGGLGPRRLIAELRERGLDDEAAAAAVWAQIDDESELAKDAAERWRRGRSAPRATAASLARHLERAGFHSHVVAERVRAFARPPAGGEAGFDEDEEFG
ncbi:MAG: regulatory protein RecX [Acidobacteriota bacterium]